MPADPSAEIHVVWERPPDWPAIFGRAGPLVVEIGCGTGEFLTELAARNPTSDHLGLEVKRKRVDKLARRIGRSGLANLKVVHGDAALLLATLFPPESLSAVLLLFPDPWPKKRHHKNRFLNPYTLEMIHALLFPGGALHLATDHADYLAWARAALSAHKGFEGPTYEGPESPFGFPTRYETYWLAERRAITYLTYRRRATRATDR